MFVYIFCYDKIVGMSVQQNVHLFLIVLNFPHAIMTKLVVHKVGKDSLCAVFLINVILAHSASLGG